MCGRAGLSEWNVGGRLSTQGSSIKNRVLILAESATKMHSEPNNKKDIYKKYQRKKQLTQLD